ncbi:MAG: OmpH family outer membrane protein [Bdellovibrionales bacterium]|nr:OmpH family outer membrane protein [Bdellovibrionales bacterium]
MKLKIFALILTSFLLIPISSFAEFKIATVDINAVLNESTGSLKQKKELDGLSKKARADIEKKQSEIKALEANLKEKKVNPDAPEAEEFRTKARDIARYVKDTEEDLKKRFFKINKELTDKALKEIETYAKTNKIDLVLDKSDKDHRGPVLFGNPGVDITNQIIKKVNS